MLLTTFQSAVVHERVLTGSPRKPRPPQSTAPTTSTSSPREASSANQDETDILERARRRIALLEPSKLATTALSSREITSTLDHQRDAELSNTPSPREHNPQYNLTWGAEPQQTSAICAVSPPSSELSTQEPVGDDSHVAEQSQPPEEAPTQRPTQRPVQGNMSADSLLEVNDSRNKDEGVRVQSATLYTPLQPTVLPLNSYAIRSRGDSVAEKVQAAVRSMHHFCMEEHRGHLGDSINDPSTSARADLAQITTRAALGRPLLGRRAVVLPKVNLGESDLAVAASETQLPQPAAPAWLTEVLEPPKSYYLPREITEYLAPLYIAHTQAEDSKAEGESSLQLLPPVGDTPEWMAAAAAADAAKQERRASTSTAKTISLEPVSVSDSTPNEAEERDLHLADPALLALMPTMVKDLGDNSNYVAIMEEVSQQRDLLAALQLPPNADEDSENLCVVGVAGLPFLNASLETIEALVEPYKATVEQTPPDLAVTYAHLCRRKGLLKTARKYLNVAAAAKPVYLEAFWQRCLLHLVHRNYAAALADLAVITRDGRYYKGFRTRADIYLEQGLYHDALTNYDLAILLYDRDADSFFQRATAYAALNENGLASEDLSSGIQLNPSHVPAIRRRAITEFRLGHFSLAINLFSDVLRLDPWDKDCYLQLAIAHHHEQQYTEAIRDLSQCIHLDPGNHLAFFWRGCLLRECHPRRALKDLGTSLLLDDGVDNIATYLNRGILYVQLKQYQQAIADFVCVLRLDESTTERKGTSLSSASVTAHVQLGLIHMNCLGKLSNAVRSFTNALRVDPCNIRALLCRAECHMRLYSSARQSVAAAALLKQAMRDYAHAIHMCPNVAEYKVLLGDVLLKMGNLELAQSHLRTATALDDHFIANISALANVHAFIGNYDSAINILQTQCEAIAVATDQENDEIAQATAVARARKVVPVLLQLGKVLMRSGRNAQAIKILETALSLRQNDCDTLVQLGICHARLKQYGRSKDILTQALAINGRHALAFYQRGLSKLQLREDKGIQDINTALALDATLWQAYLTRACYFALMKRFPKAILNCNEALRLQPLSSRAYLIRGSVKMLMHHYALALEDLTAALKTFPSCSIGLYNRGLCYQYMGQHVKSVRDFSVALLMDNGAPLHFIYLARGMANYKLGDYTNAALDLQHVARSPTFRLDARVLHTCALCSHHNGSLEAALGEYALALQRNRLSVESFIGRGNVLMDHLTPDAMARSRRDYTRAIHLAPCCVEAHVNLAINLQACGHLQQAWAALTAALKFAPRDISVLEARAIVSLQQSRFASALLDLTTAIEQRPSAELFCNRGVVHQYMGRSSLALADFRAAVAADPACALAHYNMATIYLHTRQLPQALEHLDQAVARQPKDESFRINRSVARVIAKDLKGALADLDAAAAVSPAAIHVLYNRACVHATQKNWTAALRDLDGFLAQMPMDTHAYEKRARILATMGRRKEALEDHSRAAAITYGAY